MSYTPVELRHVRVSRSLFGYNRSMVEQVIEEVAESFEQTWRERGELADRVDGLEKEVEDLKRREELLANTLVAAEQVANEVRELAKRKAELMLEEARDDARRITRSAEDRRDSLLAEGRRIEALFRAALGMVEEGFNVVPRVPVSDEAAPTESAGLEDPVTGQPGTRSHPNDPGTDRSGKDALDGGSLGVAPFDPGAFAEPAGPVRATEDELGRPAPWLREDTHEFEPIELPPAGESPKQDANDEPEAALREIGSRDSRNFDWGE